MVKRGPNGLTKKIRAFYDENPGEELTRAQIAAKFGASAEAVSAAIRRLERRGYVKSETVYRRDTRERAPTPKPTRLLLSPAAAQWFTTLPKGARIVEGEPA